MAERTYIRMMIVNGTLTIARRYLVQCNWLDDLRWALEQVKGRGQQDQLKRDCINLRIERLEKEARR